MSTVNFADTIKPFVIAGITPKWLIPLAPVGGLISVHSGIDEKILGKTPGRYRADENAWSGLTGDYISKGIRKRDYEEFKSWPTPNAGVLGRAFPGIDSDAASDEARFLIEDVLDEVFGRNAVIAERIRGKGPRRLYAFKCVNPENADYFVKTRRIAYSLGGIDHKLDIQGHGTHYVICGTHPSGDAYEWHKDARLDELASELVEIDNTDMERFLEAFYEALKREGGEVLSTTKGGTPGSEYDTTTLDPFMEFDTVMEGLKQFPNTDKTLPHREDFVGALSSIRAALGKDATDPMVEDAILDWATEDATWCSEEYFYKAWNSVEKVRVDRNSLDRLFTRNGIRTHLKAIFNGDAGQFSDAIKKVKKEALSERDELLQAVADRYIFGPVNSRDNQNKYVMRDVWDVDREWPVYDWWRSELPESNQALLESLQRIDGFTNNKVGCANFLRALRDTHPEAFYTGEIRHPGYEKGEIFQEMQPDGSKRNLINMRYLSQTIRHGRKPDPDPKRSQRDVATILEFSKRLFGPMVDYELDTLGYMAQTGDRPGSMLFLVGESGVGKSIWINMLMTLFDGIGPEGSAVIDGAALMNESARRFAFSKTEGRRIISIKELPNGSRHRDMAAVTSRLKQIVDPGPEGDYIPIEPKGVDSRTVRNFSRVLVSSNYESSINVEQQDRRIFYVKAAITVENKPDESYYAELVDIMQDPTRLAAFWRYLKTRDIGKYTRYSEPPTSSEKAERIVVEIPHAATRHMRAALEWLKVSKRMAFDTYELTDLMTECANYEFLNSSGMMDARKEYRSKDPDFMTALRNPIIKKAIVKAREFRSSKKRLPAVFAFAKAHDMIEKLQHFNQEECYNFLEDEIARGLAQHPWEIFRGPAEAEDEE